MARPDHSSSWRKNLLVVAALAVPCLGAGILFTLAGAWPILPLAGLELTALGAALYAVNRKLQYRHVITLSPDSLTLDKGFHAPIQRWRFTREAAGLSVAQNLHPRNGTQLILHDRCEHVSIGEFLGHSDTQKLIEILRAEIRVRTHSDSSEVPF